MFPSGLVELLFPPSCLACGVVLSAPQFFCPGCEVELERIPELRCAHCSEPGDFPRSRCPRCAARPPSFSRAFAPFLHEGAIARAIHRFKYEDHPELARPLGELLARESRLEPGAPLLISPIPLHQRRFRERKYDQAALLAVELAKRSPLWKFSELLERVRETQRQVGLSDQGREANLAGAFAARQPLSGEPVLLLDDVLTTGATARAAASALLSAGASEVSVLTLARARLLGA